MHTIIQTVTDFLKKYNLQEKTIVVGFSGGYDSMCLLDVLSKLKEVPEFASMKIVAAHFNHNWRGQEALQEQEVCRLFALSKGIDFYTKTADKKVKKTENDARIARYEFFDEVYDEYDADAVFTAHNFDDNAETLLYRIIKGTGLVGLKGIAEKRGYFYRPLLSVKRVNILDYCNANYLTPNNDSSNADVSYKRNYLRLNVLPSMEKINQNVKEALNTLSIIANGEDEIINEYLNALKPNIIVKGKIVSCEYVKCSKPVKLRLIHEYIQFLDIDYDYKKITDIYNFIENNITQRNGSTMSLSTALWLYVDEKVIEIIPPQKSKILGDKDIKINSEGEYLLESNKTFRIRKFQDHKNFQYPDSTSMQAYVDLSKVGFPLTLRSRRDGDVISPFGMNGTMKLKKYLNSKGVPKHKRDFIALLCFDNNVLWVAGVGLSNNVAVSGKPTHVIEII